MQTVSTESVTAEFRAVMARRKITAAELARDMGVTQMWLSRRLRGLTPLTVDEVGRLCEALDLSPAEVLAVPTP